MKKERVMMLLCGLMISGTVLFGNGAKEGAVKKGPDMSKKVNLTMVTFANSPNDLTKVNEAISKITEKKINATVTIRPIELA
ncbi:MAG: hypothetical protein WCT14_11480, partial [Treponemataceae bacterium]